jgi:hypothetical protein
MLGRPTLHVTPNPSSRKSIAGGDGIGFGVFEMAMAVLIPASICASAATF